MRGGIRGGAEGIRDGGKMSGRKGSTVAVVWHRSRNRCVCRPLLAETEVKRRRSGLVCTYYTLSLCSAACVCDALGFHSLPPLLPLSRPPPWLVSSSSHPPQSSPTDTPKTFGRLDDCWCRRTRHHPLLVRRGARREAAAVLRR